MVFMTDEFDVRMLPDDPMVFVEFKKIEVTDLRFGFGLHRYESRVRSEETARRLGDVLGTEISANDAPIHMIDHHWRDGSTVLVLVRFDEAGSLHLTRIQTRNYDFDLAIRNAVFHVGDQFRNFRTDAAKP